MFLFLVSNSSKFDIVSLITIFFYFYVVSGVWGGTFVLALFGGAGMGRHREYVVALVSIRASLVRDGAVADLSLNSL